MVDRATANAALAYGKTRAEQIANLKEIVFAKKLGRFERGRDPAKMPNTPLIDNSLEYKKEEQKAEIMSILSGGDALATPVIAKETALRMDYARGLLNALVGDGLVYRETKGGRMFWGRVDARQENAIPVFRSARGKS